MFNLALGAVILELETLTMNLQWIQSKLHLSSAQHKKPLLYLELLATRSTAAEPASWPLHISVAQVAQGTDCLWNPP